jgi:hypothetical protein
MKKHQSENALSILLDEKIKKFRNAYIDESRQLFVKDDGGLIHPGEFGKYRENLVKELLLSITPERIGIDSGFVISSNGFISSQCDIVLYDKSVTPMLSNEYNQRFYPVESVCAVGEVKSVMSLSDFKLALVKLSQVKSMRDYIYHPIYAYQKKDEAWDGVYRPEEDEKDQMITFLICESFSFDLMENFSKILSCYNEANSSIVFCHRHNMILSIKDGLVAYFHKSSGSIFQFPSKLTDFISIDDETGEKHLRTSAQILKNRGIFPQENSIEHIRHFCTLFHQGISVVSILFPDLGEYIKPKEDVIIIDEK